MGPQQGPFWDPQKQYPKCPLFLDVLSLALMLRLILLAILNCRMDDFLALFGLVCSSYVTISKGSHWRYPHDPLGKQDVTFVRNGNEMTSRILFWNKNRSIFCSFVSQNIEDFYRVCANNLVATSCIIYIELYNSCKKSKFALHRTLPNHNPHVLPCVEVYHPMNQTKACGISRMDRRGIDSTGFWRHGYMDPLKPFIGSTP